MDGREIRCGGKLRPQRCQLERKLPCPRCDRPWTGGGATQRASQLMRIAVENQHGYLSPI